MSYIVLTILAILAVISVKSAWSQKQQISYILASLILGLILYYVLCYILESSGTIKAGGSSFIARIPWREVVSFFCMIAGMAAKYFYDAIGSGNKLVFKKWQLFKPMMISPIVFGTIYRSSTDTSTSVILLIMFAFQNGFFWQTVLNKSGG